MGPESLVSVAVGIKVVMVMMVVMVMPPPTPPVIVMMVVVMMVIGRLAPPLRHRRSGLRLLAGRLQLIRRFYKFAGIRNGLQQLTVRAGREQFEGLSGARGVDSRGGGRGS